MQPMIVALFMLAALPASAAAQTGTVIASHGNGNMVRVDQSMAVAAQVDIEQIGDLGRIAIVQRGSGHQAGVRSNGIANAIDAAQSGNGTNALQASVVGDDNIARIDQQAQAGAENTLSLDQSGSANIATLSQLAYAGINDMILRQYGDGNIAALSQNGDGNQLALTQNGDGNSAQLSQNGNGLGLTLNQVGGATIAITQTNP